MNYVKEKPTNKQTTPISCGRYLQMDFQRIPQRIYSLKSVRHASVSLASRNARDWEKTFVFDN